MDKEVASWAWTHAWHQEAERSTQGKTSRNASPVGLGGPSWFLFYHGLDILPAPMTSWAPRSLGHEARPGGLCWHGHVFQGPWDKLSGHVLCLSPATYVCPGQASQWGRCPGLAPWRPQRLLTVSYLGPAAAPGSSRPVMARPQQLAATLMLRWPRCSLSIWFCVRSSRWLGPLGWAEMVRSRWFRERRKSPWPGRPKLPLRRAMRVAVFRAGRAR